MRNISKYLLSALAAFSMAACQDAENDLANPQTYPQEDAITIPGFTASSVAAINLADVTEESAATFSLSSAELPEGFALDNARIEVTPVDVAGNATEISTTIEGLASVEELQSLVENTYGKRPDARNFMAHVYVNAVKNGQAVLIDAGTVSLIVTPVAPQISANYYVIGEPADWDPTCKKLQFAHSDKDVYDDPVFTITIPVVDNDGDGNMWFAITDDVTVEKNDWSYVFGCAEGNGLNGAEGKIARRSELSDDGSFVIAAADAKFVKITLNMMDYSYTIEKLNFNPYFYEIGNDSGWSTANPLYDNGAGNGQYEGFYFLNGEFKFKPNADNWDGDYEYDGEGKIADNGGSNCPAPATGFYQINVNLAAGTYALTEVKSITCVGNHNGWNQADAAQHMTFNETERCWELTTTLKDGFKFAMNDDWAMSWGGVNGDPTAYGNLTHFDGKDLNAPEGEGVYNIKLYLSYEGNNRVVLTKK